MQASATTAAARYDALAVSSNSWRLTDLRRAAAVGKWIDGAQSTGSQAGDGKQHIEATVASEFLEDPGRMGAVRLRNFYIDGTLELADVSFEGELALESCEIRGDLDLTRSKFGAVRIVKSIVCGSIRASSVSVSRWLVFDDTKVSGAVIAADASVDGRVSCDGTEIGVDSTEGFERVSLLFRRATINGRFSARQVRADAPVVLDGARIAGQLDLRAAELHGSPLALSVKNVRVADVAHINGSKDKGPFRADGQVFLDSSEFAGGLNCNRMSIENLKQTEDTSDVVFDASNVKIAGEFFLDHGTIVGGVLLTAAEVRGQFNLSGLKIRGRPKVAIDAQGMRVGTDVWLDNGFEASSVVLLDRATIGGTLNAVAGHLIANQDSDRSDSGVALSLESASLGSNLVLADASWTADSESWNGISGFSAAGTVMLTDTHVAHRLEASGGTFDGCGGDALRAEGIRVDTDVRLRGGVGVDGRSRFAAYGAVRLSRAVIEGSLDLTGARLTVQPRLGGDPVPAESACALDASLVRIKDRLVLRDLVDVNGGVSLIGTQVGTLSDDASYWCERANALELDDFSYRLLDRDRDRLDWREGSRWLSKLHRYSAQPYLELARVERAMGRTKDARRLNIERHKARLSRQRQPNNSHRGAVRALNGLTRVGDHALGLLIGWGYARWRLAPMWATLLIVAAILFHWAGQHNIMRPSHTPIPLIGIAPESAHCTPEYPCFESFTYSLDVILPVVDFKQRENWYADSDTTRGKNIAIATIALTLLGWGFATLLAASFTNILKRE
jgi:hypothetical protein